MTEKPPLVVIAGPTASGKSALAMALSRLTPSTIVNADASQVYADLRILTARPSEADETEVPHALFGHIDGARAYSAAEWAADAKVAIAETHAARRLPILVGGTGLYIRTLLDGIAPVPPIDPAVREAVRAMPVLEAYVALQAEDPEAAARLNASDKTRIARALEVIRSTGRPLTEWHERREGGIGGDVRVVPMVLLPPRDWLHVRIDQRFEAMFETAKDEVAALRARHLPSEMPVMGAIGIDVLDPDFVREMGKDEALATGRARTRQYAKRQYTWFRRQLPSDWPRLDQQLDSTKTDELAIILRNMALTP